MGAMVVAFRGKERRVMWLGDDGSSDGCGGMVGADATVWGYTSIHAGPPIIFPTEVATHEC